jgi:hypothetical protein
VDGASAALAGVTANVRAGKAQDIPNKMYQEHPWLNLFGIGFAINRNSDFLCHKKTPSLDNFFYYWELS